MFLEITNWETGVKESDSGKNSMFEINVNRSRKIQINQHSILICYSVMIVWCVRLIMNMVES